MTDPIFIYTIGDIIGLILLIGSIPFFVGYYFMLKYDEWKKEKELQEEP